MDSTKYVKKSLSTTIYKKSYMLYAVLDELKYITDLIKLHVVFYLRIEGISCQLEQKDRKKLLAIH